MAELNPKLKKEKICGLALEMAETKWGWQPWVEGWQADFGWFVSMVLQGEITDVIEKIDKGEDMHDGSAVGASKPLPTLLEKGIYEEAKAKFNKLTGIEFPDDDFYIIGASFVTEDLLFILPTKVFREIMVELLRRAEASQKQTR